jgi:hypothetical protein
LIIRGSDQRGSLVDVAAWWVPDQAAAEALAAA